MFAFVIVAILAAFGFRAVERVNTARRIQAQRGNVSLQQRTGGVTDRVPNRPAPWQKAPIFTFIAPHKGISTRGEPHTSSLSDPRRRNIPVGAIAPATGGSGGSSSTQGGTSGGSGIGSTTGGSSGRVSSGKVAL